jgi:hypothetical protein
MTSRPPGNPLPVGTWRAVLALASTGPALALPVTAVLGNRTNFLNSSGVQTPVHALRRCPSSPPLASQLLLHLSSVFEAAGCLSMWTFDRSGRNAQGMWPPLPLLGPSASTAQNLPSTPKALVFENWYNGVVANGSWTGVKSPNEHLRISFRAMSPMPDRKINYNAQAVIKSL